MTRATYFGRTPGERAQTNVFLVLMALVGVVFLWSAISPRERITWFLEVLPVLIGVPILLVAYPRFRFSLLVYGLMALHAGILMVGGKYTYAHVPLFDWMRDSFGLGRNDYDRVGHFAQGFVPAMIVRELLLRTSPLKRGAWLFVLTVCACLAFSAAYELFEWGVAEATGEGAESFLGTQGDVWDTQKDMAMALVGAVTSLLALSRFHDRGLARLARRT